jgi:hypothetical protein
MAMVIGEPVALSGVPRREDAAAELLPVAADEPDDELEPLLLHPATVTARHATATLTA